MTLEVTQILQKDPVAQRLVALERAMPKTAQDAQDTARMDRVAQVLTSLALDPNEDGWRSATQLTPLPLWLEDALLMDAMPHAAARLGEAWSDDSVSFVDVSIASARIQETVRRMGNRASRSAATPVIPIIVPAWEQHLLATAFAAHRINRAGRRAVIITGLSARQIAGLPIVQGAAAILVSTTDRPARSRLETFVRDLRGCLTTAIPIVAGGPAFSRPYMDTGTRTGATCLDNDPIAALRACGVKLSGAECDIGTKARLEGHDGAGR